MKSSRLLVIFIFLSALLCPALSLGQTYVSGNITTDTVWTAANSPYVASQVTVNSGVTLTIDPGVVIKFPGYSGLTVNGTLLAEGTEASPITFTSIKDDSYGGDTNGDGNGSSPGPGDWSEIRFTSTSGQSEMSYCVVRYGGWNYGRNIFLDGASPTITNSTIANAYYGIECAGTSQPLISNNAFVDMSYSPIYLQNPVAIPTIENNTFNGSCPNRGTVLSGTIGADLRLNHTPGVVFIFSNVTISSGVTLTIDPGVVIKFPGYSGLTVNGTLLAEGTEASPITFTSIKDDSYGGDTNGDGNGSSPGPGDWSEIRFTSTSGQSEMSYCVVRYGGWNYGRNIFLDGASPTITNSTIANSQYGIYSAGTSQPAITNNVFESNYVSIYLSGAFPYSLLNNTFLNKTYDIGIQGTCLIYSNQTIQGGLIFTGGTLDLNGKALTILGDIIVNNCMLDVNGGTLVVLGNMGLEGGNGHLKMTKGSEVVEVSGNAYFNGASSEGYLTSGILKVGGDFTQAGDARSFCATGTHRVVLNGTQKQQVTFQTPSPSGSHFQNLEIANTSPEGVIFSPFGEITALGQFIVPGTDPLVGGDQVAWQETGISVSNVGGSSVAFADLDCDGDLDMFVGQNDNIAFYENLMANPRPGKIGLAKDFKNPNYVKVPDSAKLRLPGTFTVEFWLKVDSVSWTWSGLIGKGGPPFNRRNYSVSLNPSKFLRFSYHNAAGDEVYLDTPADSIKIGQYHHVAAVLDVLHGLMKIYVDGVEKATRAPAGYPATNDAPLWVGRNCDGTDGDYFTGALDEVRISNIARYSSPFFPQATPFAADANTVALWHMDEVGSLSVVDSSGNNLNGLWTPWYLASSRYAGITAEGGSAKPSFADIDGDGDLDLFVGTQNGKIWFYENVGNECFPAWETGESLKDETSELILPGSGAYPALVDIDNDGKLELFIGYYDQTVSRGAIAFYKNVGTSGSPVWHLVTKTYSEISLAGSSVYPRFTDIDRDDDYDLVIGKSDGTLSLFKNIGTPSSPVWALPVYPYSNIDAGDNSVPCFTDLYGDGHEDLIVGNSAGYPLVLKNIGSARITVNGNAEATDNPNITLSLDGRGMEVAGYYVSNSRTVPEPGAPGWVAVTPNSNFQATGISHTLDPGYGQKNVYVWFKDGSGKVSNASYDSIFLWPVEPPIETAQASQFNQEIHNQLENAYAVKYYSFDVGNWQKLMLRFNADQSENNYLVSTYLYNASLNEYLFGDSYSGAGLNTLISFDELPQKLVVKVEWIGDTDPEGDFDLRLDSMATNSAASQRWNYQTGSGVNSSPSVSGDRVYVRSLDGYFYCFSATTGAKLWSTRITGLENGTGAPAVHGGRVYLTTYGGEVYCLDAMSGSLLWERQEGMYNTHSPVISGGRLYYTSGGTIYCLDVQTSEKHWEYQRNYSFASSPAVFNGRVYAGSDDGRMYCLDTETGVLIWTYQVSDGYPVSPAVSNGKVFTGTYYGWGNSKIYCLDAETGTKSWEYPTGSNISSAPAVWGTRLYVGCESGKIYCLDSQSGAKVWEYQVGSTISSSPAITNGKVFFGSHDGYTYCLDAETGTQLWTYQSSGRVFSSPAVVGGKIYFGSEDKKIYCLDAGDPTAGGWPMLSHDLQHTGDVSQNRTEFLYGFIQTGEITEFAEYELQLNEVYEDNDFPVTSVVQFGVSDPSVASLSGNIVTALRNGRIVVSADYNGRHYERPLFLMVSPDDWEGWDNDTKANADVLPEGEFWQGDLVAGAETDVDYYKFTISQNSLVEIGYLAQGEISDTSIDLLDSSDQVLASAISYNGLNKILSAGLAAGTYYLRLTPAGEVDQNSAYFIAYTVVGPLPPKVDIPIAVGEMKVGTINSRTDATYFDFTIAQTTSLDISFIPTSLEADYQAELLDSNGTPITQIDFGNGWPGAIGIGLRPGTYSLKVTSSGDIDPGNPFFVELLMAPVSYEVEPNGTVQSALEVQQGVAVKGVLDVNDIEFYAFNLDAPRYIRIDFTAETYGASYNLTLYKNDEQNPIDNTVCPKGGAVFMEMGLTAGTYYFKVEGLERLEPHPAYRILLSESSNTQLEIESNNTLLFANALDASHPKRGRIYSRSDVDYYGFYVPAEVVVSIAFSSESTTADYKISITNGAETTVYQKTSTNGAATTLTRKLPTGNFYVKIEPGTDVDSQKFYTLSTTTASLTGLKSMAAIQLAASSDKVAKGGTLQVNALGNYSDATQAPVSGATWTSSDSAIATVSENGLVTGLSDGFVTIYATLEGQMGQKVLTVGAGQKPLYQTRGNLILVAGGGVAETNTLRESTQYLSDMVYGRFLARGFEKQDIYYFNPIPWHDIDGDGYGDPVVSDDTPTVADLRSAIENWAVNQQSTGPLYLALINHGGIDTFEVFPGQIITSSQLHQSLSLFQTLTGRGVVVMIEACKSGSFANDLAPAGSDRMVLTCTDDGNAYLELKGRISFTQFLMDNLLSGDTFRQGYLKTITKLSNSGRPYSLMNPQLAEGKPLTLSKERLGGNFVIAGIFPEILNQTADMDATAGALVPFSVTISDLSGQTKVWAVVEPPDYTPPGVVGDLEAPAVSLPTFDLADEVNGACDGVFVGAYGGFVYNGEHRIVFYARNADGLVTTSPATIVTVTGGQDVQAVPGDVNGDGLVTLTDAIIALRGLIGQGPAWVNKGADVNGDGKIGMAEVVYVLQKAAGLR
jgi:parallel beta-helix repeat protein